MIRSEAIPGIAFGTDADGDGRSDTSARIAISADLGVPSQWATISPVHGAGVVVATEPGQLGEADAVVTSTPGLPIAVATADCVPVGLAGERSVALAHAGWRGVVAGVVPAVLAAMRSSGDPAARAVIGPHIGPCCYEVGDEVVKALGATPATTRWGTQSVDLAAAIVEQLGDIEIEMIDMCTLDDDRFASHRRNGTTRRQVAVAWVP